ncbi:MAG TPA: methionine--tRNA ligase [Candidatus Acidoferrales bacterium]
MENSKPKYYLTTPIYYANSRPHVGSAYTTIVCDVIARYKRMCGFDVAYLTGTDEHGVNIERAAEKAGITPQELVDKNEKIFRDLWKLLGISITDFVRTTSDEHARAVQTLVRRTMERDKSLPAAERSIYKAKYEGRYCIYDNLYVTDTPEPANCQICGRPAELISEENYFFKLSKYQDRLLELYKAEPPFVQPDFRLNEARSFVETGLKDVSISRKTIKWGIPWPDDPEHVFYVWYDALTSYMTGVGYGEGADGEANPRFKKFWPADLHMIGKEIIRFHAVYWPAFLMAAGLPLPKKIHAHGWLLFEQEKMSKSKGNVAYAEPIVKTLGNDALRYYLLREVVFGQDGNFSREALITRYNADLANGLGNLASRTLTMIERSFQGLIPAIEAPPESTLWSKDDLGVTLAKTHAPEAVQVAQDAFARFDFSAYVSAVWQLVSQVDQFLAIAKPWSVKDTHGLQAILYRAAETLRIAVVLAHPVIPEATQKIWEQLGQSGKLEDVRIDQLEWGSLKPGTKIGKIEAVFPRADKKETLEKIETMENELRNPGSASAAEPKPSAPPTTEADVPNPSGAAAPAGAAGAAAAPAPAVPAKIGIEDFTKVELRVGQVKSAERIQGADKLLKLMVDIGDEVRQVLAGIALGYTPEELVGRKVVVVTNLAPRKMRGLESNGMLLAASAGADGKPILCTFAEDIPVGSKVK